LAKILIIDDDQDILDFASLCLGDQHDISTALNGEAGVFACDKASFDLILTDIFMPFRDGLDLIREVRKLDPNVKIIAMTSRFGVGHTDYLKAAQVIGAAATLQKPFTRQDLLSTVDRLLNG